MEVVSGDNWTTGAISHAKLQSNHHHRQTNVQFFIGQMTFLSPNQQCQSTEGNNITFHGLAYPILTWGLPTLSLTTNSSWLPWGMVAMPLISPVMPVQYEICIFIEIECEILLKLYVNPHFGCILLCLSFNLHVTAWTACNVITLDLGVQKGHSCMLFLHLCIIMYVIMHDT